VPSRALDSPASLREIIDAVEATGLTLTLCNAGDGVDETLRDYFDRLNVTVRTATLSTDTPANVALLHRGSDVFAVSSVGDLDAAIRVNTLDTEADPSSIDAPELLNVVHRDEYSVEEGTKLELVRISRLIETRALGTGDGAIHTGFQRLNRIDDELHTRDVYERIAQAGVTTHLYGRAGHVPNEEWYSLHTADAGELADAWFVVFDGDGQDVRKGALVCEETTPGRYTGFWTYQPDVVDATLSYLEATYGAT
jgi:hypothetical protein